MAPLIAVYPRTLVRVSATLEISEGTLSGISTFTTIWKGVAPMLSAASTRLGLTSRTLLSTTRATKGKAATTRGTTLAVVPTVVPTIARERGSTTIIRMVKGTERRMLMRKPSSAFSQRGRGIIPSLSPQASRMPSGSPMTKANRVERKVTHRVSHMAAGNSERTISHASAQASAEKRLPGARRLNIVRHLLRGYVGDAPQVS